MCAGTWEKVGDKGAGSCPFIKRWGGTAADVPAFLGGTADCPPELVARDGVLAGLTKVRLVKIALVKTAQVRGGRHIRRPRRLHTPVDACQSECRVRSQVTVGARSKEVVPFMVPAEQCEAKWELVVEDFAIGMQARPQPSSTLLHPGALAPACAITGAQVHTGQKQSNAGRA